MSVRMIVDSSSDLPRSIVDQYDIRIIPLSVHFGEEEYLDAINISSSQFYDKLTSSEVMPTTSQVPPERFVEYLQPELEAGNEVVIVTIGANASGTCQSAHIAVDELGTDKVTIIDSNALSLGTGYVALKAAELLKEGVAPRELPEALKGLTQNGIETLFCVDTLEYLVKGGRIHAGKAFVADILSLKPILNVVDAITETIGKARGRKKVVPFFMKRMAENMDMDQQWIFVGHAQDEKGADMIVNAIKTELGYEGEIFVSEIGATIGTHAGPGVLACFYKKK